MKRAVKKAAKAKPRQSTAPKRRVRAAKAEASVIPEPQVAAVESVSVTTEADVVPVDASPAAVDLRLLAAESLPAAACEASADAPSQEAATAGTVVPESPPAGAKRAGLKLEPHCQLRDAGDLQFQLLSVDFGSCDVLIDGSAVEKIDTAGFQLLIGFVRHHEGRGKKIGWTAASPELVRCGKQLGLLDAIRMTGTIPAGAAA